MTDAPIFDSDAWCLTDQERQLTAQARELGERRFADRASRYDREAKFPIENYRDLHDAGLLGICIPGEYGGHGANLRTYALTAAEDRFKSESTMKRGEDTMTFWKRFLGLIEDYVLKYGVPPHEPGLAGRIKLYRTLLRPVEFKEYVEDVPDGGRNGRTFLEIVKAKFAEYRINHQQT